jgi:hypothetical protein
VSDLNTGRCEICQQPVPTAELVSHISAHHPDDYAPFQTWPDGGAVIEYDEAAITPEAFEEVPGE